MADIPPPLPTRFPCWCRAVYSWGGESKRDLGFVEGDLIECLNAGDGSWWMGRLHRDRRAHGLFPSNFVKVLDDDFKPVTRTNSPMPVSRDPSPSPHKTQSVFRKPFQAYTATLPGMKSAQASPMPSRQNSTQKGVQTPSRQGSHVQSTREPSRQNVYLQQSQIPSRQSSLRQNQQSHHKRQNNYLEGPQHSPSRQNSGSAYRTCSPAPPVHSPSRQNSGRQYRPYSPAPPMPSPSKTDPGPEYRPYSPVPSPQHSPSRQDSGHQYRPYSPAPPMHSQVSRQPSPIPYANGEESPPPPPPPPHRVAYHGVSRAPSPQPPMNDRYPAISRGNSPAPPSPGHHTPSPLRDAMDDVMSSLQDMAMNHSNDMLTRQPSPSPAAPWPPSGFDELRQATRSRNGDRPRTALGISTTSDYDYFSNPSLGNEPAQQYFDDDEEEEPPVVSNYVQRMERRLSHMRREPQYVDQHDQANGMGPPPAPPAKGPGYHPRPASSMDMLSAHAPPPPPLHSRRSAYEMNRTSTTRTTNSSATQSTSTSASTQLTGQSLMSGPSAGEFSATSAGSLARRKGGWTGSIRRPRSAFGSRREHDRAAASMGDGSQNGARPVTPLTGISYHSSHDSGRPASARPPPPEWRDSVGDAGNPLGGLASAPSTPLSLSPTKQSKGGFLRRLIDTGKTVAASTRSSIAGGGQEVSRSPVKSLLPNGVTAISSNGSSAARDMGLGGGSSGDGGAGTDWMQVRRDVNRSNSLSRIERQERIDRCLMMDRSVVDAVDLLEDAAEGDEGLDGAPVPEPTAFHTINLHLVDRSARFITSLPPLTNPASLAQGYVCRPYRSDLQRARAIFTWVAEKIAWEEAFEGGDVDCRRAIQSRRGTSEEVSVLVFEMCSAVGLHAEVVHGYLKPPGELPDLDSEPRPNHWWNMVLVDGEWRLLDCSLASPTHPQRAGYSSAPSAAAEPFYFLARPLEACYTHVPLDPAQQHIVPPVANSILLALPCALPPYFRNRCELLKYSTALLYLEGLEMLHIQIAVPSDTEIVAAVAVRSLARDPDGDLFESGTPAPPNARTALAQPRWLNGRKVYTVKAVLPSDEGWGTLHVHAGKRGLMHSARDNPHPVALSLPIFHSGANPPYEFLMRHPTPHAQRHDLYVLQPQCRRLACNNTFVFAVRQHPSALPGRSNSGDGAASLPLSQAGSFSGSVGSGAGLISPRPGSALSMTSSSASGSNPGGYFGSGGNGQGEDRGAGGQPAKPAKLAVQAPSGKILRLSRKVEGGLVEEGGTWETIIKVGERGTWRGLVLADRSARWCVWGEWECV